MPIKRQIVLAAAALAILSGSAGSLPARAANDICPVVSSQGWEAWLAETPYSNGRLMLYVRGSLSLPTPGYMVSLRAGPTTRSMPPTQIVVLETREPENRIVSQVVVQGGVSVILPGQEAYESVRVVCGNTLLHEFTDVPVFGRDAREK
ncbi:hypothetical protein CSC94_07250 [Zhengella mangrovi]|uniref:Secreted protein n=1 Tax=Zhengella mangrovi TaxID=1982044 RepID=A0A2G1QPN6_9HYPH|nr:hypothetical protein [Zhengella mangrovi]PHP67496.1 hypothetical protein CSC94_07250 [Zhengella mangrovi]